MGLGLVCGLIVVSGSSFPSLSARHHLLGRWVFRSLILSEE